MAKRTVKKVARRLKGAVGGGPVASGDASPVVMTTKERDRIQAVETKRVQHLASIGELTVQITAARDEQKRQIEALLKVTAERDAALRAVVEAHDFDTEQGDYDVDLLNGTIRKK